MDGCNVLPVTQFVGTRLRVDTTWVLYVEGSLPPWGAARERSEFSIKPPLGAPLLICPRGYLLKSFPQVDTSSRQWGFEIRVFSLLDELPKAIEPHLPVCLLYRWQLSPNMWSSPTTKSLDPIVVSVLLAFNTFWRILTILPQHILLNNQHNFHTISLPFLSLTTISHFQCSSYSRTSIPIFRTVTAHLPSIPIS